MSYDERLKEELREKIKNASIYLDWKATHMSTILRDMPVEPQKAGYYITESQLMKMIKEDIFDLMKRHIPKGRLGLLIGKYEYTIKQ